jgi:serine O-acetyltransferase
MATDPPVGDTPTNPDGREPERFPPDAEPVEGRPGRVSASEHADNRLTPPMPRARATRSTREVRVTNESTTAKQRGTRRPRRRRDDARGPIADITDELCDGYADLDPAMRRTPTRGAAKLPSQRGVAEIIADLRALIFPGYAGPGDLHPDALRYFVGSTLDRVQGRLAEQIQRSLCFDCGRDDRRVCPLASCRDEAGEMAWAMLRRLPAVRSLLATDVRAHYEGDPAARSPEETILCYPGMTAVTHHRIAHELFRLDVPLLPRIINEQAHAATGIDIHPGASIGGHFFIDHGTGVVIGETCRIGPHCRIYQGVTLGAKSFPLDAAGNPIKGVPRHPILGERVTVYAGATILGRIEIGDGAIIGGNVWVTQSVAPGGRVSQAAPRRESFSGGAGI